MENLYGVLTPEPSELELANRALALEAAKEGIVLLKNNGALPLITKKVALYGMGARKTVKGGLGSGSVNERYSVNIEDGLKNAGVEITTQRWLNDYDSEVDSTYKEYVDMVEEKIAGLTNPMQIIPLAHSFVYRYPSGRLIDEQDVAESQTDTAVYVLMRQAGEGNDRKLEQGDYYLTESEKANLYFLTAHYTHTILVINVGGGMEMKFLDEISGIDAVVQFVQGGEEGGNALAALLTGQDNFSGKLADTIPMEYDDIPFGREFSYINGDLDNEYYKEGIYVGYRYFDSFEKAVRYPFGFGLSYTTFNLNVVETKVEGTVVRAYVDVTNSGKYPGREVVQAYLSAPAGKLHKEYQKLVAFAKTDVVAPGETVQVELTFDLRDCGSYDEDAAAYLLEQGSYVLRIGNSSRNTTSAAVLSLSETVVLSKHKNCCVKTDSFEDLRADPCGEAVTGVPVLTVDAAAFETVIVDYTEPDYPETEQEKAILDGLTVLEQSQLLMGGDLQRVPAEAMEVHGAAGKTATNLLHKGIRNVVLSDGPAGINIVESVCIKADGTVTFTKVPERYCWGAMRDYAMRMCSTDGTLVYRYATAWPVEMLLAQTWNTELMKQVGEAVGKEMAQFGITVWLAPGMNIHRNPLGGRAFEYYSEDPYLTGKMAAALTRGVHQTSGCTVSIKHFCCNNTEDNRNGISANLSERALREIYLKGFEIAVKESQPGTVMSSYNMVNHVYTPNSHELLTDILRCEWGFKGLVMSDWGATNDKAAIPEACAPAGNDLIMPGNPYDRKRVAAAVENGSLAPKVIRKSACRVLRLMLNAKTEVLL